MAKNHQFLGVNYVIAAVGRIRENQGKLGVFWHTQGSGKSFSMVFFSRKVLCAIPGNWTFVIVTDRKDLDGQIYRNFASTGAVIEEEEQVRAKNGDSLRRMLEEEDHRYVFTLIRKFHTERGERYPVLSQRSDIIVVTDEAHRSQYDIFAANMRAALPNAAFIGFTGTPLVAEEERTREVFGDYVSVYNFKQSVDDRNTVPLYYENRIPELQLVNDDLDEDIERIMEAAELDDVVGALAALRHRDATGEGQAVDVSLLATGVTFMQPLLAEQAVLGRGREQSGATAVSGPRPATAIAPATAGSSSPSLASPCFAAGPRWSAAKTSSTTPISTTT